MGVVRRANRKFRYSRTELGNHYTGVEANNKRNSFNAYLLDFLKTSLRAEFTRLFYRFVYGFKAQALQGAVESYARYNTIPRSQPLRTYIKKGSVNKIFMRKMSLYYNELGVGWRFKLDSKYRLGSFLRVVGGFFGKPTSEDFKNTFKLLRKKVSKDVRGVARKLKNKKFSWNLKANKKKVSATKQKSRQNYGANVY